ncbi:SRPBCC family protein [Cupriavidus basilensis]|nr:SRPBCC family protein [Cupriavidus basilensis]
MLKPILLAALGAIALLLIYAATQPDTFRVERSASVKAPPERVFALINDLHNFNQWNPYEKKDPSLKGTYGATRSGQGAAYAWESEKVGVGSMEIVQTEPAAKVTMRLDFIKPFEAHNTAEFTLMPQADATKVTWSMQGSVPYFAKLVHLVFNMDKMVGKDFEQGLVNLKTLAEAPAAR